VLMIAEGPSRGIAIADGRHDHLTRLLTDEIASNPEFPAGGAYVPPLLSGCMRLESCTRRRSALDPQLRAVDLRRVCLLTGVQAR